MNEIEHNTFSHLTQIGPSVIVKWLGKILHMLQTQKFCENTLTEQVQ